MTIKANKRNGTYEVNGFTFKTFKLAVAYLRTQGIYRIAVKF